MRLTVSRFITSGNLSRNRNANSVWVSISRSTLRAFRLKTPVLALDGGITVGIIAESLNVELLMLMTHHSGQNGQLLMTRLMAQTSNPPMNSIRTSGQPEESSVGGCIRVPRFITTARCFFV